MKSKAKIYLSGVAILGLGFVSFCLYDFGVPKNVHDVEALMGIFLGMILIGSILVLGFVWIDKMYDAKKMMEFQIQKMFYDMNRDWLEDEHRKSSDEHWIGLLPPRMKNPFAAFNGMIKARDKLIDMSNEFNQDHQMSIEKNPKFYPKKLDNVDRKEGDSKSN